MFWNAMKFEFQEIIVASGLETYLFKWTDRGQVCILDTCWRLSPFTQVHDCAVACGYVVHS